MRQSTWLLTVLSVSCGVSAPARAEFTQDRPSIQGTGEVLPQGAGEVGVSEVAYGLGGDTMLRVPSALLLLGYGKVELRHRLKPTAKTRVSPYVDAETPRHVGVGSDFGFDFGAATKQSLTFGARLRHGPYARPGEASPPIVKKRGVVRPNFEYDAYLGGNLAYAGMADYLPYAGYTWAFTTWHVGLIVFPVGGILPLPYVYWRF